MNRILARIKKILIAVGDFNLRVILAIAYFLVLLPYALGYRLARLFSRRKHPSSQWHPHAPQPATIDALRRQS